MIEKRRLIYLDILWQGALYLRDYSERPFYFRLFNRPAKEMSHLLHLIPPLLIEDKFCEGDVRIIEKVPNTIHTYFFKEREPTAMRILKRVLELHGILKSQGFLVPEVDQLILSSVETYYVDNTDDRTK